MAEAGDVPLTSGPPGGHAVPRERSGRRSHPKPIRSVADVLPSFVEEASTKDSMATLIAMSLLAIHEVPANLRCTPQLLGDRLRAGQAGWLCPDCPVTA